MQRVTLSASACGKAILLGEHAVVYGKPALAVPLPGLRAVAEVETTPAGTGIVIDALDIGRQTHYPSGSLAAADLHTRAMVTTISNVLAALGNSSVPDLAITLRSQIPPARGLGSGTAVTCALIRALSAQLDQPLDDAAVSALALRTEVLYHGNPSGVDNTVIAHEKPLLYQRGQPLQPLGPIPAFALVIADSGIASRTVDAVERIGRAWEADQATYEDRFARIGQLTRQGCAALQRGDWPALGAAMNANQALLAELGVSTPQLNSLIAAALTAGALGAKLTGGGLGGCVIALVDKRTAYPVTRAFYEAGAKKVWKMDVGDADRD